MLAVPFNPSLSDTPDSSTPPPAAPADRVSVVDLLIRRRDLMDEAVTDRDAAARLLPRLVGISVVGVAAFSVVQGGLLTLEGAAVWPAGVSETSPLKAMGSVFLAYSAGLFGAQVASLPSAYFYALLAGVKTHGWRVAVEAMRAQATSATVLLGLLPVYFAVALGVALGFDDLQWFWRNLVIGVGGYTLPFVAGLGGVVAMLRAFTQLVRGPQVEGVARSPMPVLLVLSWSVLFTAMAPLAVWRVLSLMGS